MSRYSQQGYRGRKKKRDANEPEIIEALEDAGVTVVQLDNPVDLLCGVGRVTYLLEVKNPDGKNKQTDKQRDFYKDWLGLPATEVRTPREALAAVGILP